MFQFALLRLLRTCYRRPKTFLILFLIPFCFAASHIPDMKYALTADDMREDFFPSQSQLEDLKESYDDGPSTLLSLAKREGPWTEIELCRIRQFFEKKSLGSESIRKMDSTLHLRKARGDHELFGFPLLLNPDCSSPRPEAVDLGEVRRTPLGFLYTGSKNELTVLLSFTDTDDFQYGSFDPAHLVSLKESVERELLPTLDGASALWFGNADYMEYVVKGLELNSWINLLFCAVMILLLRLFLGTWRAGMYYIMTLIITTVFVYGLKTASGVPMDALSDCLFLMLGVAGLEDFIFSSYLQATTRSSWKKSFRKLALPSLLTSVTTAIGFGSLVISDLSTVRELGKWAAVGALVEWAVIYLFLPAFLLTIRASATWVDGSKARFLGTFMNFSMKGVSRRIAVSLLVVYPLAFAASYFVNANDSYLNFFPKSHPLRTSYNELMASRGWGAYFSVVFDAGSSDERQSELVSRMKKLPHVRFIESGPDNLSYLKQGVIPEQWDLLKTEYLFSSSYKRYRDQNGRNRLIVYIDTTYYKDILETKEEIEKLCAAEKCFAAGSSIKTAQLSQSIPQTLNESELLSALIVFAVVFYIALSVGRVRHIWAILLGAGWAPAAMIVLLTAIQMPVNFLTCIFGSVLIGLAGDSGIQFLLLDRKKSLKNNIRVISGATFQCAAIMGLASLLFSISYFDPPRVFGIILLGGLLASVLGEAWISKALVNED